MFRTMAAVAVLLILSQTSLTVFVPGQEDDRALLRVNALESLKQLFESFGGQDFSVLKSNSKCTLDDNGCHLIQLTVDRASSMDQFVWSPASLSSMIATLLAALSTGKNPDLEKEILSLDEILAITALVKLPPALARNRNSTINSKVYSQKFMSKFMKNHFKEDAPNCFANFVKSGPQLKEYLDITILDSLRSLSLDASESSYRKRCFKAEKSYDLTLERKDRLFLGFATIQAKWLTSSFTRMVYAPFSDGPTIKYLELILFDTGAYHTEIDNHFVVIPLDLDVYFYAFLPTTRYANLSYSDVSRILVKDPHPSRKFPEKLIVRIPAFNMFMDQVNLQPLFDRKNIQTPSALKYFQQTVFLNITSAGLGVNFKKDNSRAYSRYSGTPVVKEFFCDEPFLFAIMDKTTQTVFYLGQYNAPKSDEVIQGPVPEDEENYQDRIYFASSHKHSTFPKPH